MAQSSRDSLANHVSFKEKREEGSERDEDTFVRHSKKRVAIKRPPRARNDEAEVERGAPRSSVRRTRTVPAHPSQESTPPPLPERRSRRNLSRHSSEELGDDILLDSSKRIDSSQRSLKKTPSERVLKPTLSKRSGRAATPLDIPFAPNHPGVVRTMSAETRFEELLDMEMDAPKTSIRRTRTHVPTSHPEETGRSSSLRRDGSLRLNLEALTQHQSSAGSSFAAPDSVRGDAIVEDSAKHLDGPRRTSKKGKATEMGASSSDEADEHVITMDQPSKKKVSPPRKESSKKLAAKTASQKSKKVEPEKPEPLTWIQLLLHYLSLIIVQYPFKYHRQWLEKMYRSNRLERPPNHKPLHDWALNSTTSSVNGIRRTLPSLPENCSTFTPRTTRSRRRTTLDVDDPTDEFGSVLETHHRKRSSRVPGQATVGMMKPPPGHLPRSQNISVERSQRKKSRRSVEIIGDIMHALGVNTKNGRLKLPFGLSEMDESELSGFQARLYKFIKRQHKGRLARAWDHMVHPLSSMQKKHRRSTNKTRLLNAIDKYRAQRFESGVDMVRTSMFLFGQWVFEALSPPKYTKKPMLFTVLFPLVLILFFGFMAGEYPLWRERDGDKINYDFGPVELATWLFRAEKWRTFDDGFLIIWGARYLPLVTTESWRWLFSMLVHENFAHLGGNLFLFVILSWSLESKYGFLRTGMICWLSGISGNFISAALEDACGLVLGASGCVFGLAAFYIMDVIGDFRHVSFPCLRLIGICTFLSAFIIALTSHQEASHLSHIGGFLCGMGLSVVLVPRFIDERIEAFLPWISLFSAILLLCVFPLVVLLSVIPTLQCSH